MKPEIFEPIIKVEDVTKIFGQGDTEVQALRGISLDIFKGEFVIIFGPSGSGKSTLLNVISGLDSVSTGTITVDAVDISELSMDEKAQFHRDKIGIVFQAYNLIPTLTVRQNIALPLVFSGIDHLERRKRADKILADFKLVSVGKRLPSEISGGQQQRIGIMRALINNPPILIADEPTGNLDSKTSREVMQLFRNLNTNLGVTIVVVTHDPTQFPWADRVVHVLDGKIIKQTIYHQKLFYTTLQQDQGVVEDKTQDGLRDDGTLPSEDRRDEPSEETEKGTVTGTKSGAEETENVVEDLSGFERLWEKQSRLDADAEYILRVLQSTLDEYQKKHYSEEQILDIIQAVRRRIRNQISEEELTTYLNTSISKGGAGLYKPTVEKIVKMINGMLQLFGYQNVEPETEKATKKEEKELVFDTLWYARHHLDKESEHIVELLRDLLSDYQLQHLERDQLLNLIQITRWRLSGLLRSDEIYNILHQSISEGGASLYKQTAHRLADDINSLVLLFESVRKDERARWGRRAHRVTGFEVIWSERERLDPFNRRILQVLNYTLKPTQKQHLTVDQIHAVLQIVRYRLEGILTASEFERYLDDSKGGGAGLYKQTARTLSTEIEQMIELFKEGS